MKLSRLLRELRDASGMEAKDVAEQIGVGKSTLDSWHTPKGAWRRRARDWRLVEHLCSIYGASWEQLQRAQIYYLDRSDCDADDDASVAA